MHDPDELEIALHPRLLEVIAEAAERFPDRQALVHLENPLDDKPRIWTFREVIDAIPVSYTHLTLPTSDLV